MTIRTRSHARSLALLVATGGAVALLGTASPAHAEDGFPGAIQQHYGGDCAPQCTLCHTRPEGGPEHYKPSAATLDGYVSKDLGNNRGEGDFFANMVAVNGNSLPVGEQKLLAALEKLRKNPCTPTSTGPCDSDGDKTIDMDEFKNNGDPDVANGHLCIGPTYGCGAMIQPLPERAEAKTTAAAVLALLGVGLVFVRRARR